MMKQYREKELGIEIEAVQLTHENVSEVVEWCHGLEVKEIDPINAGISYVGINVPTPYGNVRISEGSYLIKLDSGKFFVSGPNAFKQNFEEA